MVNNVFKRKIYEYICEWKEKYSDKYALLIKGARRVGKLDTNLGYIYENAVAQMLTVKGNNLFYYTMESETSHHLLEIDFLISSGDKICPLEIKSGNYKNHKSLDVFCNKFSNRVKDKYVVHTKDYKWENGIHYIPVYMIPFL